MQEVRLSLEDVRSLSIIPNFLAEFQGSNLAGGLLELRRIMKDPYIQELLDGKTLNEAMKEAMNDTVPGTSSDDLVHYETILATGYATGVASRNVVPELRQLLNPTFCSRIKVYHDLDSEISLFDEEEEETNVTEINGIKIKPSIAESYIISIDGGGLQRIQDLMFYGRNAKERIFDNCPIIDDKPKWKFLPLDIFKQHMECGTGKEEWFGE